MLNVLGKKMEKKWSQHVPLSTIWSAFQKETKEEIDVFFFS